MVAQGKCGVALITEPAIGVHGPAGQDRGASLSEVPEHRRIHNVRRAEQHFALGRGGIIPLVFWKTLAELFVDLSKFVNSTMQHQRQAFIFQAAEQFLAFAQRIAEQNRSLPVVQGVPAKSDHSLQHLRGRRENVLWSPVSCFHDQNVGCMWLAWFG